MSFEADIAARLALPQRTIISGAPPGCDALALAACREGLSSAGC